MSHQRLLLVSALLVGSVGAHAQTGPVLESTAKAMLASGPACGQAGGFSGAQRRLLQKASQGVAPLRDYVYITRGIHQYNMAEVGDWIDGWRADQAHCGVTLAREEDKR